MASYAEIAAQAAQRYGLDPAIFTRQIQQESGFDPTVVSPSGATGIAQFMPATAQALGIDPNNPVDALYGAARLMRQHLDTYGGDYAKALAAYNAGAGAVDQYGDVPPYAETQRYVRNILGDTTPQKESVVVQSAPAAGSPPVATQTANPAGTAQSLTGADIIKLGAYLADLLAGRNQSQSGISGYYDPAAYPGQTTPTLERERFGAARSDAERNYNLDVQRFGLAVAQQNFNQKMQQIDAQTRLQGPGDWLKYSYLARNKPLPEGYTSPPTEAFSPTAPYTGVPTAPALSPDQQKGNALAAQWNQQHPFGSAPASQPASVSFSNGYTGASQSEYDRMANVAASTPGGVARADQATNPAQYANSTVPAPAPAAPGAPATTLDWSAWGGAPAGAPTSLPSSVPQLAWGGGSKPMRYYPQDEIPMDADGGGSAPMGGMEMAIVGDPQRPGQPNRELAVSESPITVVPENRMSPELRAWLEQHAGHFADGGSTFPTVDDSTPFVDSIKHGAPAFAESGLPLGPFGRKPFSFTNYQRALPSEQAMLQGYIDTPAQLGGIGGSFADEYQRSKNAAFTGARDFPYRSAPSVGYGM